MTFPDYSVVFDNWSFLMRGLQVTLSVSALAVIMGFLIGSVVGLLRLSRVKPLKIIAGAYVEFIRGTPLLVQLAILYFGLPSIGIDLSAFAAAVIGLSVNSGAYLRLSGQGSSLSTRADGSGAFTGMNGHIATFSLCRSFPPIIPPRTNFILIKDSSLLSTVR